MGLAQSITSQNLQQWHRGDRSGLDALLARHIDWIQARVRKRLGPGLRRMLESGDVVQDAAVQFLNYGPRFIMSDERQFKGLLARIIENVLRDKHDWFAAQRRQVARLRPLPSDTILNLDRQGETVVTPSVSAQRREDEALIRLGIEFLDPEDREVIVLRQWEDLSFAEVGERLGVSSDAAWMRHNRAVGRLGKKVGALRRGEIDALVEIEDS